MSETQNEKKLILRLEDICIYSCLVMSLLSYKLYFNNRDFPLCPVFEWFPNLPNNINFLLVLGILWAMVFNRFIAQRFIIYFTILVGMLVLILFDINRLQAFVYTYYCCFFLFLIYYLKLINEKGVLLFCQLVLIGIYLGSGIHKINPYFNANVFEWWLAPFKSYMSNSFYDGILPYGILIGYIEVFTGIFLMFSKTRMLGLSLAIITHLIIMFTYMPPFRSLIFACVVLYNFSLVNLVYLLFKNERSNILTSIFMMYKKPIMYAMVFVFVGIPIAHRFFNIFPAYISYDLFGGRYKYTYFVLDEKTKKQIAFNISTLLS